MSRIRIWLAVIGAAVTLSLASPVWAEEKCGVEVCFGVDWKTAAVEEAAEININAQNERGETPLHFAAMNDENPAVLE